jgi:predicted Zn finger-like uncharacterized protein
MPLLHHAEHDGNYVRQVSIMKTTCPECSERFDVSTDMIGKKAKCGECAHVFVVPESAEKKAKKDKGSSESNDVRQTAWLSLYLAGMAVGLLLFRGHQGGLIASMIFSLAIETAALYLAWLGFWNAWNFKNEGAATPLVKTAIVVNGIMIGLLILSVLLTLYALIASPSAGSSGGLGGMGNILGDLMKNSNEINKLIK